MPPAVGHHGPHVADDRLADQDGDHQDDGLPQGQQDAGEEEVPRVAGAPRQVGPERNADDAVDRVPHRLPTGQPVDPDEHRRADRAPDGPGERGALGQVQDRVAEQRVEQDERQDRDARLDQAPHPAELLGDLLADRRHGLLVARNLVQVQLLHHLLGQAVRDMLVLRQIGVVRQIGVRKVRVGRGGAVRLRVGTAGAGRHRGASSS